MSDEEKKKQKLMLIAGGVVLAGALGYWYFTSSNEDSGKTDVEKKENDMDYIKDEYTSLNSVKPIDQIYQNNASFGDEKDPSEVPDYPGNNDNNNNNNDDGDDGEMLPIIPVPIMDDKVQDQSNEANEENTTNEPIEANEANDDKKTDEVGDSLDDDGTMNDTQNQSNSSYETELVEPPKDQSPVVVEVVEVVVQKEEPIGPTPEELELLKQKNKLNGMIKKYNGVSDKVSKFQSLTYKNGTLKVKVIKATNIDNKDGDKGWSDGFIQLSLKGTDKGIKKTKIIEDQENPVWNETFEMSNFDTIKDTLLCRLYDRDKMSSNDFIGVVEFNIIDIAAVGHLKGSFDIDGSKTKAKLFLEITYSENLKTKNTKAKKSK